MKSIRFLFVAFSILMLSRDTCAQYTHGDSTCACEKFPYYFCTDHDDTIKTYCEDNPTNPTDIPGNIIGPTVVVKAPNPLTCIKEGVNADTLPSGETPGNLPGYGWVLSNSGVWIPGVNIDNDNYPLGGGAASPGTIMDPNSSTGGKSYLSVLFTNTLTGALHNSSYSGTCTSFNSSCCVSIVFQSDEQYYLSRGLDPQKVLGNIDLPNNLSDCQIQCSNNIININVTEQLLYDIGDNDSIDYTNNPPKS